MMPIIKCEIKQLKIMQILIIIDNANINNNKQCEYLEDYQKLNRTR